MADVTAWQALGYTVAGGIVLWTELLLWWVMSAALLLWWVMSADREANRIWNEVMDGDYDE